MLRRQKKHYFTNVIISFHMDHFLECLLTSASSHHSFRRKKLWMKLNLINTCRINITRAGSLWQIPPIITGFFSTFTFNFTIYLERNLGHQFNFTAIMSAPLKSQLISFWSLSVILLVRVVIIYTSNWLVGGMADDKENGFVVRL